MNNEKMWFEYDLYIINNKENLSIEDARLLYYFCDQVDRFGYTSAHIIALLDTLMHFNNSAWKHIRKLEAKGAFV